MDDSGVRNSESCSGNDARFHQLVAEYIDLLNRGDMLDKERIVSDHPDIGHRLLERLELFQGVGGFTEPFVPLGTLGDYTLRRQIGRGGMGVVYEAWENSMDRRVALKVLPAAVAADNRAFLRFMREAKTAGQLSHPNVVPVFAMGVKDQTPYYALEYVEGKTLAQILAKIKEAEPESDAVFGKKDRPGYFEKLAEVFAEVADGLQHAHSKGVVHRDIKPSNLILDGDSRLRILDFGLARLEGQESLTFSGDFFGTPLYMSPEQAKRKKIPVDHRTDIYSLGTTMYEALCGRPPFRGKDHADTLSQIIERDPVEPRKINPRVPKDLGTIVLKCLRKGPDERYGTAEALGQDLRRFVRGDPVEARPESRSGKVLRALRRHRTFLGMILCVLLLGMIGTVVGTVVIARERDIAADGWAEASRQSYVSSMRLAQHEWRAGNLKTFEDLLQAHIPGRYESDLRGWEWYYLRSLRRGQVIFEGHSGDGGEVAWSHDGRLLATSNREEAVAIWDATTESTVKTFLHESPVAAIAWSPAGPSIVIGRQDGILRFWHVGAEPEEPYLSLEGARISNALAWSPDGQRLASASAGDVTIWSARDGKELVVLLPVPEVPLPKMWQIPGRPKQNIYALNCVTWSPGGRWVAVAAQEPGRIFMWDSATWEPRVIDAHLFKANAVAFSPDGWQLATGGLGLFPPNRGEIRLWDLATGAETGFFACVGEVHALAWNANGGRLASAHADGSVRVWEMEAKAEPLTLRGHSGRAISVAWNSDPRTETLASGGFDGSVRIWDPSERHGVVTLPGYRVAAWSPDSRWVASGSPEHDAILVFDALTGEKARRIEHESGLFNLRSISFSPDGRYLAAAGDVHEEGRVTIRELSTLEPVWAFAADARRVRTLDWSPDGRYIATGGNEEAPKVWDFHRREELCSLRSEGAGIVETVTWSRHGRHLAVGFRDQVVRIWEADGCREVRRLRLAARASAWRCPVTWSADGERLAVGTTEGEIVVFESNIGEEIQRIQAHALEVISIAWSPDGERLASGSSDCTVKLWDPATGDALLTLDGKDRVSDAVWSPEDLSWSPDGRHLAAAGRPAGLKVWTAVDYEDR